MYCRKCGKKISDHAQFCDHCGAEVVIVPQQSYADKYKENKKKAKSQTKQTSEQKKKQQEKYKYAKNPYIAASLFASIVSLACAIFPWNLIGEGIGTSLPMRIIVVVFALLGDYHATKAKQTNRYLKNRYGFEIQVNAMKLGYYLSIIMTIMGLFALFMYGA